MRHEIMVNPVSGKKRGSMYAKRVKNLLHRYGVEANIFESEYAGHLREHAKEVSSQELTRFYSLGGDGTLNEIVSGIYGTDSEIVVLPCGTGNDFARYYNEYESLRSIVLASLHSNASKIDIMKLNNDRYCINILNGGFDFGPKIVEVPDVSRLTVEAATEMLESYDLTVSTSPLLCIESIASPKEPTPGSKILSQALIISGLSVITLSAPIKSNAFFTLWRLPAP